MADKIRVIIVDDLPETRENVKKLLQFEQDIEVIGQAGSGEEAIEVAQAKQPDIILMDINMPGIDGIGASQKIADLVPLAQIIIMSVQSDSDYLRRAMLAGARDFLTKPFGGDELISAVRRVYKKRTVVQTAPAPRSDGRGTQADAQRPEVDGNLIVVFSPKGGSGCTTVATNVAVALAKQEHRCILIDASLQFGDVAVTLYMKSITTLLDISSRESELDQDLIKSVVQVHNSGLNVLLAPPSPEMAEMVTDAHMKKLIALLRGMYDFIIIDTSSSLTEITLSLLDNAERIILVAEQTLPSLKNVSNFLNLTESLDYSPQKTWLVVNKVSDQRGIPLKKIENTLKRPIVADIPEEYAIVDAAINQGKPLVTGANQKRPVSVALANLADFVAKELGGQSVPAGTADGSPKEEPSSLFGRFLGKR